MAIAKKGTLLIISGPKHDPDRKHLHIICNDPDADGNVAIVGVCSIDTSVAVAYHDATCVLQKHEHDFIKHDSYVLYARASIVTAAALEAGVKSKVMVTHDDMNGQTFLRITKGVCRSPHTPRKVKNYLGCAAEEPDEAKAA